MIETALSDRPGVTELFVPTGGSGSEGRSTVEPRVASGERSKVEVKLTPLDDLDLHDVAFVKIDVEGHELPVLRGAKRTLTQQRPVVLIEIEQRGDVAVRDVVDHLVEQGLPRVVQIRPSMEPDRSVRRRRAPTPGTSHGRAARLHRQLAPRHVEVRQQLRVPARRITSAANGVTADVGSPDGGPDDAVSSVARMRRDWEERAGSDPLYYIDRAAAGVDATRSSTRVDPSSSLASSTLRLMELGVDPAGRRVLEIGCGMGRLFEGLSARFGEVWGIDISETMIAKGREHCPVAATWLVGDGRSLTRGRRQQRGPRDLLRGLPAHPRASGHLLVPRRVPSRAATGRDDARAAPLWQRFEGAGRRPCATASGAGLGRSRCCGRSVILPVVGDIDTWLGCIVAPDAAVAELTRLGFDDVAVLPDDVHVPGLGYSVVGRVPADLPGSTAARSARSRPSGRSEPVPAQFVGREPPSGWGNRDIKK